MAKTLDFIGAAHGGGGFLKAQNNLNKISVLVEFFLEGAKSFLVEGAWSPEPSPIPPRLRARFQGAEWVSEWWFNQSAVDKYHGAVVRAPPGAYR